MNKNCYLFIFFLLYYSFSFAQSIEWQKSFGGSGDDFAYCIRQTHDRGYIVAGISSSNDIDVTGNHGGNDDWIVKLDSMGVMKWQKSLGGSDYDTPYSIEETKDRGYIVAGYTHSNDGDITGNHGAYDYWIVKLDSLGSIEWEKSLGGTSEDKAYCAMQTNDAGYIIAGYSGSNDGDVTGNNGGGDYWIVKLDSAGSLQWQKSLGGSARDEASSILQTSDEGYIVAGYSKSIDGDVTGNHGNYDYWIVKLNSSGDLQWQRSFGGSNMDFARSAIQTTDKGYIIAGTIKSNDGDITGYHGGNCDYWIVKLDSTGVLQWQKTLGGSNADGATCVKLTEDGGYIISGSTSSDDGDVTGYHGGAWDYWLVKLFSSGNIQWQKTLGGSNEDNAGSIEQTTDGNYIIAGGSYSSDGDAAVNHGFGDYWIVKLSADVGIEDYLINNNILIYPNPFGISTRIVLTNYNQDKLFYFTLYDINGRNIFSMELNNDVNILSRNDLQSGIYVYKIICNNKSIGQGKLVIE